MTALLTGWTLKTEQGVLRISIAVTLVMAGVGVLFGLLSGSYVIVFDGVYEMTDATMTIVALSPISFRRRRLTFLAAAGSSRTCGTFGSGPQNVIFGGSHRDFPEAHCRKIGQNIV